MRKGFEGKIQSLIKYIVIFFIFKNPITAYARPGGGSSSGGGGISRNHSGGISYKELNLETIILNICFLFIILFINEIIKFLFVGIRSYKKINLIKKISIVDSEWNYSKVITDVKESYKYINKAWVERNQDIAKDYASNKLNELHRIKIQELKDKKEININKIIKILYVYPVEVSYKKDNELNSILVYARVYSKDYTINEDNKKVIIGQRFIPFAYSEYWKFVKEDSRWVLDEIRLKKHIK